MPNQKGFIPVIVIILITLIIGGGVVYLRHNSTANPKIEVTPSPINSPSPTPTPSPSASVTPTATTTSVRYVDCVGPDGKHVSLTQKDCDAFTKAWVKPTPTPQTSSSTTQTTTGSGNCSLGTVNINVQPSNGDFVGQVLANISVSNNDQGCAGNDSKSGVWDYGVSSKSYQLLPATYKIEITYHGKTFSDNVTISGGSTVSKTITVSN